MKKFLKITNALIVLMAVCLLVPTLYAQANNDDVRIEFVAPSSWDSVHAWAWNDAGNVFTGSWPGPELDWNEDLEAYVIYVDADFLPFTLILNNNAGTQTDYIDITESVRIDHSLTRVEFLPPGWNQVHAWAWNDNGDVFDTGWPGPSVEWDESAEAFVLEVSESYLPFTLILHNNEGSQTEYLEITENTRIDMSGLRLGFTHPNWTQVRVWAWDANGDMFDVDWDNAPLMEWDEDANEWVYFFNTEGVAMPFNVIFHNGAGEQTRERPVTRPDTVVYERVRLIEEEPEVEIEDETIIEEIIEEIEENEDNIMLIAIISGVVVAVVISVVVVLKKRK